MTETPVTLLAVVEDGLLLQFYLSLFSSAARMVEFSSTSFILSLSNLCEKYTLCVLVLISSRCSLANSSTNSTSLSVLK